MRRALLHRSAHGRRPRRHSARFRLTALYCALFFPSAVVLVFITYALIVLISRPRAPHAVIQTSTHDSHVGGALASQGAATPGGATVHIDAVGHSIALGTGQFLLGSCIVLIIMIGVSVLLGWIAAGRVLGPLRVMSTATRRISEHNLHDRLALTGPDDELKDLGDTIDGLLARLDAAFESQRRFVANAAHELRTPLMLSQTLLQVAMADPDITLDSLQVACKEAMDANRDHAQIIDALLTLARSQRGLEHREPVHLAAIITDVVAMRQPSAAAQGRGVDASIDAAEVSGNARLIHRLVSNLIDNAIGYNTPGGRVQVKLAADATAATLTVTNTGPLVPPDQVSRLLEPFQRATADRTADPHRLGLGLSIVSEIAEAHGADLDVRPRRDGGLTVTVRFPDPITSDESHTSMAQAPTTPDNDPPDAP